MDDLLNEDNINNETPVGESKTNSEDNYCYKSKLRIYIWSGQMKDLYSKIITEHE